MIAGNLEHPGHDGSKGGSLMIQLEGLKLTKESFLSASFGVQHEDAENIGYIIPPPVIQHFITDFERNGRYTAFPALGIEWQKMESPFLRKALGMKARPCLLQPPSSQGPSPHSNRCANVMHEGCSSTFTAQKQAKLSAHRLVLMPISVWKAVQQCIVWNNHNHGHCATASKRH
jgi:hypothetical protein